jgi:hypothetical protein
MTTTILTKYKVPDEILAAARSQTAETGQATHILRQADAAGEISYALSQTAPDINTPRNSLIATIEPDSFKDQLKAISTALDAGKTVCIAVPNQSSKALIRREPIEPKTLRIVGDHPDVTFFSNGAWLIFLYTTIQNTIKDRQFNVAYFVPGKNLTPMAQTCETENLALLKTATSELHQLQLEDPEHNTANEALLLPHQRIALEHLQTATSTNKEYRLPPGSGKTLSNPPTEKS